MLISATFEYKWSSRRHITEALDEWYYFLSKILLAFDNIETAQEFCFVFFSPKPKKFIKIKPSLEYVKIVKFVYLCLELLMEQFFKYLYLYDSGSTD